VISLREQRRNKTQRGDAVTAAKLPGRRVAISRVRLQRGSARRLDARNSQRGFSLIELVITVTVLTILTMGVVPLMKLAVKRQKEQQLHEALRQMRQAIDDFHRDTVGMQCTGTAGLTAVAGAGVNAYVDPRSKVVISDCTVFGVDNPDRYPPDLETLVNGVNVIPRGGNAGGQGLQSTGTAMGNTNSVLGSELATKKKVYLRSIPIDPMTGHADWDFRSCYDPADGDSWGHENVFDVRSKSKELALNGDKYSDW
jgi:general secretion pathway protein G